MQSEGANENAPATGTADILSASPSTRTPDVASDAPAHTPSPAPHWHSRGYLPHFESDRHIQAITFRLHDSLPSKVIEGWRRALAAELASPAHTAPATPQVATLQQRIEAELHRRILAYEDAGHGACYLRDPRVAEIVQNALLYFDSPRDKRYHMLAWCVMPNHVHVVIEPIAPHLVAHIVRSWKSYTAKEANKHLRRTDEFWMREYFDRYIRNPVHLANAINYTEDNPVKAGLVANKTQWRWSSVHWDRRRPAGTEQQNREQPKQPSR